MHLGVTFTGVLIALVITLSYFMTVKSPEGLGPQVNLSSKENRLLFGLLVLFFSLVFGGGLNLAVELAF